MELCSSFKPKELNSVKSDGNASVNGENTGTSYTIYISGLEATGTSCGN